MDWIPSWNSPRGNSHFFWEGGIPGFPGMSLPQPQLSPGLWDWEKSGVFLLIPNFFQAEGTTLCLKDSQILAINPNLEVWDGIPALPSAQNSLFQVKFPGFSPVWFFFFWISQKSGNAESQKKSWKFFQHPSSAWSCFSQLKFLQISGKRGRGKNSGILGERKTKALELPEIFGNF